MTDPTDEPTAEEIGTDAVLGALRPLIGAPVGGTLYSKVREVLEPVLEEIADRAKRKPWMKVLPVEPEPGDLDNQVLRVKLVSHPHAPDHVRETFQRMMEAQQPQEETDA